MDKAATDGKGREPLPPEACRPEAHPATSGQASSEPPKDDAPPDLFIVGIGASAGGLEALKRFLDNAPDVSNLAYVVVQHPSPDSKSLMASLIGKIVEQERLEKAVAKSEERYRATIDITGTGCVVVDSEGRVLDANGAYLRMTQHESLDAIRGRSVLEWAAPEAVEANAGAMERTVRDGHISDFETVYLRPDGSRLSVLINAMREQTPEGPRLVVLCRDLSKRKRDDEAIRRLSQFPEENPYPVLRITHDGALMYANPAGRSWLATLGWQGDGPLPASLRAAAEDAFADQRNIGSELTCPAGHTYWLWASPLHGEDYVNVYVKDITDRKNIEDSLRENEARLHAIFEGSPDAYFIMEIHDRGRISACNKAAEAMLRGSKDQIIGQTPDQVSPERQPDGRPSSEAAAEMISTCVARGKHDFEWMHRRLDGVNFWTHVTISVITIERRKVLLVSWRDISERKCAEERIRLLSEIVERSPVAVILTDVEANIQYVNPGFTAITGYTQDEVIGQNPRILQGGRTTPEEYAALWRTLTSGAVWRGIFHNRKKNGDLYWGAATIAELRDARGTVTHYVGIQQDVTEAKAAEDTLRRSNAELEQFAYVASHDLKEPLRMIRSYTSLLGEEYREKLDEEADKYIGYVTDGVARMQALIDDLLSFSRIGKTDESAEPVDLLQIVKRALDNLESAIVETRATIQVDMLPTVIGHRTQLVQLLQNLIGNAIKFHSEAPPRVQIAAHGEDGNWHITVDDNGIGIEPEYRERVFRIFQRLHARDEYPGTGIGLAICKKIVERHGGRIWVDSKTGQGTTFHFTLPRDWKSATLQGK